MWVMISPKGEGRGEGERRGLLSMTLVLIRCAHRTHTKGANPFALSLAHFKNCSLAALIVLGE